MFRFKAPFRYLNQTSRWIVWAALALLPIMMFSFQNCAKVGVSEIVEPMLAPSPILFCQPKTSPEPCQRDHGSGSKDCNDDGMSWGPCKLSACDPNYQLFRGECDFTGCTPGDEVACGERNGFGMHVCNAAGTGFGACTITSCRTGFYLSGANTCSPWICTPNTGTQGCPIANGTGSQVCNSIGSGWNGCVLVSCQALFHPVSNSCQPDTPCIDVLNATRVAVGGTGVYGVTQKPAYCANAGDTVTVGCPRTVGTCTVNGWTFLRVDQNDFQATCGGTDYDLYPTCP